MNTYVYINTYEENHKKCYQNFLFKAQRPIHNCGKEIKPNNSEMEEKYENWYYHSITKVTLFHLLKYKYAKARNHI